MHRFFALHQFFEYFSQNLSSIRFFFFFIILKWCILAKIKVMDQWCHDGCLRKGLLVHQLLDPPTIALELCIWCVLRAVYRSSNKMQHRVKLLTQPTPYTTSNTLHIQSIHINKQTHRLNPFFLLINITNGCLIVFSTCPSVYYDMLVHICWNLNFVLFRLKIYYMWILNRLLQLDRPDLPRSARKGDVKPFCTRPHVL